MKSGMDWSSAIRTPREDGGMGRNSAMDCHSTGDRIARESWWSARVPTRTVGKLMKAHQSAVAKLKAHQSGGNAESPKRGAKLRAQKRG